MDTQEMWQVDVNGQIYEAKFEELTQWIAEGALLPQDKVRRGNLRWISAIKVPALYGFFNAKELGIAPPTVTTSTGSEESAETPSQQIENFPPSNSFISLNEPDLSVNSTDVQASSINFENPPQNFQAEFITPQPQNSCLIHTDTEPAFICDGCGNAYCKLCPKSFGGTVKVCPMCGAMCKPIAVVQQNQQKSFQYSRDFSEGFGFGDFGMAFAYPFKFKVSLIFGALMFVFFSLGQSASAIGGMFMFAASISCTMLSNMLTFGILANTAENMSQGKLEENFMPSFDDFNLWDDVVHPFFLSLGVYIVSFGLLIAIIVLGAYLAFRSVSSTLPTDSMAETRQAQAQVDLVKQAENFKQLSADTQKNRLERQQGFYDEDGEFVPNPGGTNKFSSDDTEENVREAQKMIEQHQKSQLESVVGKTQETKDSELRSSIAGLLGMAIPFLFLAGLAAIWGIFYFPAACAIAGYTRSFAAVLNPLVGLDTIRRMGFDYAKLWFMGILLLVMGGIVGGIFGVMFMPFNLPGVGNVPATACTALFTFYFSVVYSVTISYALYKNSAKLNLFRG